MLVRIVRIGAIEWEFWVEATILYRLHRYWYIFPSEGFYTYFWSGIYIIIFLAKFKHIGLYNVDFSVFDIEIDEGWDHTPVKEDVSIGMEKPRIFLMLYRVKW